MVHKVNIMACLSGYVNPAYKITILHDLRKILPVKCKKLRVW